jgi:hypothetical protein
MNPAYLAVSPYSGVVIEIEDSKAHLIVPERFAEERRESLVPLAEGEEVSYGRMY